jgi:hypothetical protein
MRPITRRLSTGSLTSSTKIPATTIPRADLPPGDMLGAGISCVNHTQANTQKAYEQGASLFDLDDPDYEARVTRSERDAPRPSASCNTPGSTSPH